MAVALMFRAGRLQLENERLVPKSDPGFVRIIEEDGTLRLQWVKRNKANMIGDAKMDVPLAKGSAEVARVGPNSTRSFKIYGARYETDIAFFWMQELKPEEDDYLLRRLKETLSGIRVNVSPEAATSSPPSSQSTLRNPEGSKQIPLEENSAKSEPMELCGSSAQANYLSSSQEASEPSKPPAAAPANTMSYRQVAATGLSESPAMSAAGLASILSGIADGHRGGNPDGARSQREAALALQEMRRRSALGPSLVEILSPNVTIPLAMEPGMLECLSEQMPPEHRSLTGLRALLESPQLRRHVDLLHRCLSSGELDLQHFGLRSQGFSPIDFLKSVQEKFGKSPSEKIS